MDVDKLVNRFLVSRRVFGNAASFLRGSSWGYRLVPSFSDFCSIQFNAEWCNSYRLVLDRFVFWLKGIKFYPQDVKHAYNENEDGFLEYLEEVRDFGFVVSEKELGNWLAKYVDNTVAHDY